jgi:uncharacterized protein
MTNPYHYGTPVSGDQFAGREQETAGLVARMRDGINVVVISPRRYGKTSLLARAADRMRADGAAVVEINVLRCRDLATFAAQLANHTYRLKGGRWHRMRQAVPEFLRRLRVSPSVTFEGDQPRFSFSSTLSTEDAETVIADVYAVLEELSQRKPAVLVLDEFQAITTLGAHLPSLFKALADANPHVSLVLAGSKRHLMERLIVSADAPLFGMAERFALDVLPDDVMTEYLRARADVGGKPMSQAAAERLVELAGPVPNDVQQLAYEVFNVAERRVTVEDVEQGLLMAVEHEATLHADRFESLAPGQRRVLSELASTPASEPYSAGFARDVALATAGSVRTALDALIADELVSSRGGVYRVANPFFAAWLRESS